MMRLLDLGGRSMVGFHYSPCDSCVRKGNVVLLMTFPMYSYCGWFYCGAYLLRMYRIAHAIVTMGIMAIMVIMNMASNRKSSMVFPPVCGYYYTPRYSCAPMI